MDKNKIDNKPDDQLFIIQANIESNRKYYNERMKKLTEDITTMIAPMMYQIKYSEYSPEKTYSPKSQGPTAVVPANKRAPPL